MEIQKIDRARRRQALHDPPGHLHGRGQPSVLCGGERYQQRPGDREPDADLHQEAAAEPVGQAPNTTMNSPDMSAVTETARLATVESRPRDCWMPGMMLSRVWANSQKLMTAMTTPSSHQSVGCQVPGARCQAAWRFLTD
jgi:hypothetical protein